MRYALIVLLLAGCGTAEQRGEKMASLMEETYGTTCSKIGYAKDTDGYRDCLLRMFNGGGGKH